MKCLLYIALRDRWWLPNAVRKAKGIVRVEDRLTLRKGPRQSESVLQSSGGRGRLCQVIGQHPIW